MNIRDQLKRKLQQLRTLECGVDSWDPHHWHLGFFTVVPHYSPGGRSTPGAVGFQIGPFVAVVER
jgi:hypothetical protein